MKVAFVDLDDIVLENSEREHKAEQFANSCFVPEPGVIPSIIYRDAWRQIFYSERAFYKPEWVVLDTLIEGVHEALDQLQRNGYAATLLTSRPESMRKATEDWLASKALMARSLYAFELVMKAPSFQYVKTVVWKAGMVQTLASLYDADDILVVDDSPEIRQGVLDAYSDGGDFGLVQVAASLDEAVKLVEARKK